MHWIKKARSSACSGVAGRVALLTLGVGAALPWAAWSQELKWTPPPSDPKSIEGVWLPGGYANGPAPGGAPKGPPAANGAGPPAEIGGLDSPATGPGGPPGPGGGPPPGGGAGGPPGGGGPPPGAAQEQVSGSTLECTPVQRLSGAGGGMSNLWIQGPKEIVMISEEDMDIRKIYLNMPHPAHVVPQPNGNSIGHWEGDTLVVDSVGFGDAKGHDTGEHVVERIHKSGNALIDEATITQDGKTRNQTMRSSWRSDLRVSENVCEENFSRFHFENGQLIDQTQ